MGNLTEEQLLEKSIILEKDQRIAQLENELANTKNRALTVFEENQTLKASDAINEKRAMLEYELKIAEQFSRSGAFPKMSPEQCYTLMKAGEEMGLAPIVALNMLYVVNGKIGPYGDKMLGYILSKGYKVKYENETEDQVTVTIYKEVNSYDDPNYNPNATLNGEPIILASYTETAKANEQVLQNSKALKFARGNKLRFHAIRKIASFHLPHLFMGCGDSFSQDYPEWAEGEKTKLTDQNGNTLIPVSNDEILEMINQAKTIQELDGIKKDHKKIITKDINLVSKLGERKKELEL